MSTPPKITAVITIVETNEVHNVDFVDVEAMMESVLANVNLSGTVLGRNIKIREMNTEGDHLTMIFAYADTDESYMTVAATRHITH